MELNYGEKYKVLGANVIKLLLCAIGYLFAAILVTAVISPTLLDTIFKTLNIDIYVDTSGELLPGVIQYILMVVDAGLVCAVLYFVLAIFMNRFKMYENAFVIKRPFRIKTVVIEDICSIKSIRQTSRWGIIPVSVSDVFIFEVELKEGKNAILSVKSGQYRGLKSAMMAYDKAYNKGWF